MNYSFKKIPSYAYVALFFLVFLLAAYKGLLENIIEHQMAFACTDKGQCDKRVLLLTGEILQTSVARTALALGFARLKGVKTVCMSSSGGNLDDAITLARVINTLRMDTCLALYYKPENASQKISGLCQSSCTWLILGGRHRYLMDDRVILGFHASRDAAGEPAPNDLPKLQKVIRSLQDNGAQAEELVLLAKWAFTQGHTPKTKDCTAHELQSLYPYFTNILSWQTAPDLTCGLPPPG